MNNNSKDFEISLRSNAPQRMLEAKLFAMKKNKLNWNEMSQMMMQARQATLKAEQDKKDKRLLVAWILGYMFIFGGISAYAVHCSPVDNQRDCAMQIKDALSPYQQQKLLGHGYTYRSALKWCHKNEDFNHQIETVQLSTPLFPH